jgi:hypothetical protein
MTDNFPEDEAMLETSIALSGSMMAFERLPLAEAPVLDRSNSDLSFDVRRNGLKAGKPAGATTREIVRIVPLAAGTVSSAGRRQTGAARGSRHAYTHSPA